jgi:hypothetical protein
VEREIIYVLQSNVDHSLRHNEYYLYLFNLENCLVSISSVCFYIYYGAVIYNLETVKIYNIELCSTLIRKQCANSIIPNLGRSFYSDS